MRIPLKFIFPLCAVIVFTVWWIFTKQYHFIEPPSPDALAEIHREAIAKIPQSRLKVDAISSRVPFDHTAQSRVVDSPEVQKIDTGDLSKPRTLDQYSNRAPEGAIHLFALAAALEAKDQQAHALLAYERVLDLSQRDTAQIQQATREISRLRAETPIWNKGDNHAPEELQKLTIHLGTGRKFENELSEIMQEVTQELHKVSSGLLQFSFKLNVSLAIQTTNTPTPVAIWITGDQENAPSTDAVSFLAHDKENLREEILKTTFRIARSHLIKNTPYNPVPEATEDIPMSLRSHITRLLWKKLGQLLNTETPSTE